jgi:hypothetical protein
MDQNFQTSFIPKKPIVEERDTQTRPVGFFVIVAIFILFAVLLGTGGVYFYKEVVTKSILEKETSLTLAKKDFEPSKISELQLLDKRLRSATEILSHHIAITPIFRVLSDLTMKTIRYTKFSYSFGNEKKAKISVKMSGQAVGYRSVALQSDLFATKEEGKNFIDPVFSNLSLDDKGNVLFDLEFLVDPSFVDYKQMILTQI